MHRRKLSATIQQKTLQVEEQLETIKQLVDAPIRRTESVRIPNQSWQLAHQAVIAQQESCARLEDQLRALKLATDEVKGGNRGANYGATIGIAIPLFLMASGYDMRKDKPLGVAFVVGWLAIMIGMGIVGYWVGKYVHESFISGNDQLNVELARIKQESSDLEKTIIAEQKKLAHLSQALNQLTQFTSETTTVIEETRVL
ncbi:hypothetical protein [Spirosoma flavum]|uniref:Uncharacterized protein n=1 Tax=Spirosoma flavum TaxID=2048557 RepID=A0ABW6AS69_9BACT